VSDITRRRLVARVVAYLSLLAVCAAGGALVSDAQAQGRQAPGRPGGAGRQGPGRQGLPPQGGNSPVELQELMDAMVLVQAERDLELSNEQFPQFLTRLKELQGVRRRSDNLRNRAVMELRRLLQPGNPPEGSAGRPDDAQIRERLKAIDDAEARALVDIKQARSNLEQVLNVRQQARFRLLEEQIERRKLELFARSRQPPPQR
jgi:hypothetical protein